MMASPECSRPCVEETLPCSHLSLFSTHTKRPAHRSPPLFRKVCLPFPLIPRDRSQAYVSTRPWRLCEMRIVERSPTRSAHAKDIPPCAADRVGDRSTILISQRRHGRVE